SASPSFYHPFGTDNSGYDTFAVVMRGTQRSLEIAIFVAVVATSVGSIMGAIAGYYGGLVDSIIMRFIDMILIFPAIAVAAFLARQTRGSATSWLMIGIVLSALAWPIVARIARSETLKVKTFDFIAA